MAGEVDRLMREALHQAAVARDDIGVVVDEVVAEARRGKTLRDRHADGRREALSERAGRRLDAGRVAKFGVAGGGGAELAEILEVGFAHARIAKQVVQGVEQHGAVAGGEHETVAVGPVGAARVELHEALEEHGRDVGHAHRHAGMTGLGLFDGVHGERADGVCAKARVNFCF